MYVNFLTKLSDCGGSIWYLPWTIREPTIMWLSHHISQIYPGLIPSHKPNQLLLFWWSGSALSPSKYQVFGGAWEVCTARLFRRRHLGKNTARFAVKPRYAGSRVSKITELSTFQPSTYFNQLKSRVSPKKFGHESGQDSSLKTGSVDPQQLHVEPLSLPSRSVEQQWVHHPPGPRRSVGSH